MDISAGSSRSPGPSGEVDAMCLKDRMAHAGPSGDVDIPGASISKRQNTCYGHLHSGDADIPGASISDRQNTGDEHLHRLLTRSPDPLGEADALGASVPARQINTW